MSKATLKEGVRVKHLFRVMTHYPDLWFQAYANIHSNRGAITPGVNGNTLDGMGEKRINNLIARLKSNDYCPTPVKRVHIPKPNGKTRPLGIPTGDDKLVQEVVRMMLEAIYEPVFSQYSHGFRPKRSCHTALTEIVGRWKGVKWFVETDIASYYDSIDHDRLIVILEKKIDDPRFLGLIKKLLKAGYLEDWKFHETYSGTPQGGIASPILANIYLHELDQFVEKKRRELNLGEKRGRNEEYHLLGKMIANRRAWLRKLLLTATDGPKIYKTRCELDWLLAKRNKLPSKDQTSGAFRRLQYVRYADDFLMGVVGTLAEAQALQREVAQFLETELGLNISTEKSGIRHSRKGVDFLGYHLSVSHRNARLRKTRTGYRTKDGKQVYGLRRSLHSTVHLDAPQEKIWGFLKKKGYIEANRPVHLPHREPYSDYEIVSLFNAEMRGFANYYALAPKSRLFRMEGLALRSLFKTLASKHKTKARKIRGKMKQGDDHVVRYERNGEKRSLKVFKIKYRVEMPMTHGHIDREPPIFPYMNKTEVVERLNAKRCEYCGTTNGLFEVHHIRKLKDMANRRSKQPWEIHMIERKRKTMILCEECHSLLHGGRLPGWRRNMNTVVESVVQ